jgi:hypothetical protein
MKLFLKAIFQPIANPVIAETTGTNSGTAAAWPSGWTTLVTGYSYSPSVTLASSLTIKFRKGAAMATYAMASSMGRLVVYTPPPAKYLAHGGSWTAVSAIRAAQGGAWV